MIALVIPSNRPESLARWEREWKAQIEACPELRVYVVRDEPATWQAIRDTLGTAAWIIPVQTDCIRSYGYWQAWRDGATHILTMDDDCYPTGDPLLEHVARLEQPTHPWQWVRTLPDFPTRGMPLSEPVGINHGLWSQVPDLSAAHQVQYGIPKYQYRIPRQLYVRAGKMFAMSGMNLAWRRALTPLMYFGLMGSRLTDPTQSWGVHRFGDIWCGVLAKHICDHLGYVVRSGTPVVRHDRASDPHRNLILERPGEAVNPWLWRVVQAVPLTAATPTGCVHQLADALHSALSVRPEPSPGYWRAWTTALHTWATLFESESPSTGVAVSSASPGD